MVSIGDGQGTEEGAKLTTYRGTRFKINQLGVTVLKTGLAAIVIVANHCSDRL